MQGVRNLGGVVLNFYLTRLLAFFSLSSLANLLCIKTLELVTKDSITISYPRPQSEHIIDSRDEVETSDDEPDLDIDEAVHVATDTVVENGQISLNPEKMLGEFLGKTHITRSESNNQVSDDVEKDSEQSPSPPSEMSVSSP